MYILNPCKETDVGCFTEIILGCVVIRSMGGWFLYWIMLEETSLQSTPNFNMIPINQGKLYVVLYLKVKKP